MRIEPIIAQRFDELLAKADAIKSARTAERFPHAVVYYVSKADAVGWATSSSNLLQRVTGPGSSHCNAFNKAVNGFIDRESEFDTLRAVIAAAKEDYIGGYLFTTRALVKAEVLDDALMQARVLLDADFKDPACILIGVALEVTLKELVEQASLTVAKLDKMNTDLCKAGKYNMSKQKLITAWAELRNKAAHGEWSAYTKADIDEMYSGVERFVADYLH